MNARRRTHGFTLIEVIVSLVVISILAGIATVGLRAISERTETAEGVAVLDTVFNAQQRFSSIYDTYTAWPDDITLLDGMTVTQGPSPDPSVVSMAVAESGSVALAIMTKTDVCATSLWPPSGDPGTAVTGTIPAGQVCEARAALPSTDPAVVAVKSARWDEPDLDIPAAVVPSKPRNVGATTSAAATSVFWTPPATNGGSAVTGYTAEAEAQGELTLTCTVTTTSCDMATLPPGVPYTLSVYASNSVGNSGIAIATISRVITPAQVSGVVATPGNSSAAVTWTAVTSTPSTPVAGYRVFVGGVLVGATTATNFTVNGLINGQSYSVQVAAFGGAGQGTTSGPVTVTPRSVPGAPTSVSATAGNTVATINWSAPGSNGGSPITGYNVAVSAAGYATRTCSVLVTNCNVSGLTNGVVYQVSVAATNEFGASDAGTTTVTAISAPGTPTALTATPANVSAVISWTAVSSTSAAPVSGYRVFQDGILAATTTASTTTLTGLTNGTTYAIGVAAFGPAGQSGQATAVNVTPRTVPSAPSAMTITGGSGSANVSWSPSMSNGGSALTGYTVTGSAPGQPTAVCTTATTSCAVAGLTNGVQYTISLVASNAAGNSTPPVTATVTPITVPGIPNVTLTPSNTQIKVDWTTVANTAGAPVYGYRVFLDGILVNTTTQLTYTAPGLTNGQSYSFSVAAYGPAGQGTSDTQLATPATVAGAPTGVAATVASTSSQVSWTAPASNGGSTIMSYTATATGSGQPSRTCTAATSPCTLVSLTNGVVYAVSVVATNSMGPSSPATTNVTPLGAPAQVTGVALTAADTAINVAWSPILDTPGAPLAGYRVYLNGVLIQTITATTTTIGSLVNGTNYNVQVAAYGTAGQGTSSAVASATPVGAPGAPSIGTASVSDVDIAVTFTAPAFNGGSSITGYTVTLSPGSLTASCAASPCTVSGAPATTYTATVRAQNAAGTSAPSASSNAVTTRPDTPTGLTGALVNANPTRWQNGWAATATATSYDLTLTRAAGSHALGAASVAAPTTSYTWMSQVPGTSLGFRVRACNSAGCSGYALLTSTTPATAATDRIVADAPSIWWPFNDDSTTALYLDYSGNNRNGTANALGSAVCRACGSIGQLNGLNGFRAAGQTYGQWQVTQFPGTPTFGAQIAANGVAFNTRGTSMSAWIFMDGNPHSGLIMGLAGANGNTISLGVGAGTFNDDQPGYRLVALTEGVCWMTGPTNMPNGWNHIALTVYADGSIWTWLNGVAQHYSTGCAPQTSAPTGVPIVSGANGRRLIGVYVAHAQFYNTPKNEAMWVAQNAAGRN